MHNLKRVADDYKVAHKTLVAHCLPEPAKNQKRPTMSNIDYNFQETLVHDIIHLDDAFRHSIIPGDKVLAPAGLDNDKFLPGVVLEGVEKRFGSGKLRHIDIQ